MNFTKVSAKSMDHKLYLLYLSSMRGIVKQSARRFQTYLHKRAYFNFFLVDIILVLSIAFHQQGLFCCVGHSFKGWETPREYNQQGDRQHLPSLVSICGQFNLQSIEWHVTQLFKRDSGYTGWEKNSTAQPAVRERLL